MPTELIVRRADQRDFPSVLELARRALGWNDQDASFLEWKHLENPFGVSPMWIALDGDRVVGFRTFLRWNFVDASGRVIAAARAVDTATDPEYQGRGIFTRLTLDAIEELPAEGIQLIFNTPNGKSLPGYLKMGWREVGRLPVALLPTSVRFPAVVATARRAADRHPLPSTAGEDPRALFDVAHPSSRAALGELLATQPGATALTTLRTPEFLAWRYGLASLGYRVVLASSSPAEGIAVFRRRPRGRAVEAVLCEVLVPHADAATARKLVRRVAGLADADYLIRLDRRTVTRDPFLRLPRVGPVLACRPLDASPAPELTAWALTMGDVELF